MQASENPKIGFVIYTYDRVDDAKINMEILRHVWDASHLFADIKIVHCFNGDKSWYTEKTVEDDLVRLHNSGHFCGASDLIDAGMDVFAKKYPDTDYVIVLAADTWLINPQHIAHIIHAMAQNNQYIATCPWGLPRHTDFSDVGMATDFFIVQSQFVHTYHVFPFDYKAFDDQYGDFLLYNQQKLSLERLFLMRFTKAVIAQAERDVISKKEIMRKVYIMKDRMPVHSTVNTDGYWVRTHHWEEMGLLTHHDPAPKKEIIKKQNIHGGENLQKLLSSHNLEYFNHNVRDHHE